MVDERQPSPESPAQPCEPRPRRSVGTVLAWLLVVSAVMLFAATLFGLLLRLQWDAQEQNTAAWFEENVGRLESASYQRPSLPEASNLAATVRELSAEPLTAALGADDAASSETLNTLSDFARRVLDQPPLNEKARERLANEPVSAVRVRAVLDQPAMAGLSVALDRLEEQTATRIDLRGGVEALPDLLPILGLYRLRKAEVALALHDGDCEAAGAAAIAIERIASVGAAEAPLLLHMLDGAVTREWQQIVQELVEAELEGRCASQAPWLRMDAAERHLAGVRRPVHEVLAFEASLVAEWDLTDDLETGERYVPGPIERLLGQNAMSMRSSMLTAYGMQALETGITASEPLPSTSAPACWFDADVLTQMLMPNLSYSVERGQQLDDGKALTDYALAVRRCAGATECEPASIQLPVSSRGIALRRTQVEDFVELSFVDERETSAVPADQGNRTLRLPAALVR